MEKITGYAPEVCRAANALRRSYSFARVMEGLKNISGFRVYEFKGTTFEIDHLVSGVYKIARIQYRDMEGMGQRYLAWEILEDIDSHYRG